MFAAGCRGSSVDRQDKLRTNPSFEAAKEGHRLIGVKELPVAGQCLLQLAPKIVQNASIASNDCHLGRRSLRRSRIVRLRDV